MSRVQEDVRRSRPQPRLDTDPRFKRRRATVQRQKRRRLFISLGVIAVGSALVWGLFFSPLLIVKDVKVSGARFTDEAEIAEVADLIGRRQNLLLLPTEEVRARVEELAWVAEADVDRMLPGTVRIKVTEHKPALVLSLGSARWTIDKDGRVLATGAARDDLPVLAGVEVGSIEPGLQLMTDESEAALAVFRSLPGSLRKEVVGVFAPTPERISLSLAGGTTVRYGSAERGADKNEVLRVLLGRLKGEGPMPAYIDVRVPTSPAVSPAAAEPVTPPPAAGD